MDLTEQARKLHENLAAAVRLKRRCMRDIAVGLAEMRGKKLYRELGYASLAEYGEQALGFRDGKTGQLATLGDRLAHLPELDGAMAAGAIGWTTARTIARVATPETEEAWITRAMQVSSRELEDLACDARTGDPPRDPDDDMDPYRNVWITACMDVLAADLLMRAFASMRHRWGDISSSQMLMLMAERELDDGAEQSQGDSDPRLRESPGENDYALHHRVIEHRCPECDKAWVDTDAGKYELDRAEREHIEEDAEIVHADADSGKAGHVTRTIPPAVRRAVLVRDQGKCQVPGCRSRRHLEIHHLEYRSAGGTHHPDNLTTLCWTHHSMVHKDTLRLERGVDGHLRVKRRDDDPLGIILSIWRDRAEIDHDYLDEFDDGPGGWGCIEGYWGKELAKEAREHKDERTFVPPVQEDEHVFVRKRAPSLRYPRGKLVFRYGDDQRPAPFWMERGIAA
jgi:5-methylcytosine-specific restriction endonuclease McrA